MRIRLAEKTAQRINARFSKYSFEVGILKDGTYRKPKSKKEGLNTLAKGPARKASRLPSKVKISDVSRFNREERDYLTEPFNRPTGKDQQLIKRFLFEFLKMTRGNTNVRRLENLLQAMVRNPLARSDYGNNATSTAKRKGFDRLMIDTGQLFRAIKARVLKVGRSR